MLRDTTLLLDHALDRRGAAEVVMVTRNPRDFEAQGVPVLAYGQPPAP